MKHFMKSTIVGLMFGFGALSTASAFGTDLNPGVVGVEQVPGMVEQGSTNFGTETLNPTTRPPVTVMEQDFTGAEIEESIKGVRTNLLPVYNDLKVMLYKKANPVKANMQAHDEGISSSEKDISDMLTDMLTRLGVDKALFSEKDPIATPMIPIGDSGYKLPTDTKLYVVGNSSIQAPQLKVDGKVIGHFRVLCGGYDKEDVIINNTSKSYCVTSMMTTGVSRNSGVHKGATTKVFFVGVSEPYVLGQVAQVNINWSPQPKSGLKGTLERFNLMSVPKALRTMEHDNTMIMQDGSKRPGYIPEVSK